MKKTILRGVVYSILLVALSASGVAQKMNPPGHWVSAWSTSVQAPGVFPGMPPALTLDNQTIREIIRPTIGGERLRVRFSNELGTTPLALGGAHIALVKKDGLGKSRRSESRRHMRP